MKFYYGIISYVYDIYCDILEQCQGGYDVIICYEVYCFQYDQCVIWEFGFVFVEVDFYVQCFIKVKVDINICVVN